MTDIIDLIRLKQRASVSPKVVQLEHKPEMLYIGCVDARLDPIDDIGIQKGKALIYRNIAALVHKPSKQGGGVLDAAMVEGNEIPESVSMGAVLEFFVKHIPGEKGKVKHIVVSGHTHCGGIRACCEKTGEKGGYLRRYLSTFFDAVKTLVGMGDNEEGKLRALEKESVRQSIKNLMEYDVVREAVKAKKVQLHGWVIDTATQRIEEMDKDGQFKPMTENEFSRDAGAGRG